MSAIETTKQEAADRLYDYLLQHHWRESGLVGPDSGIRFNYRIGRFAKSYLSRVPWRDDLYYLQAQGYWILANWRLSTIGARYSTREIAVEASDRVLAEQRADGAWSYPHPEWSGRVTTYEGVWASLGLLETYRQTAQKRYLNGALRWHEFAETSIGYQRAPTGLAANYFASGRPASAIPNATTDQMRFLAELADATGDIQIVAPAAELLAFLADVQLPSGELPYEVVAGGGSARLPHYQCFQYNAFECLGLLRYQELTGDRDAAPIIGGLARFLETGVARDGSARYQCGASKRRVTYHAAALAAALAKAAAHQPSAVRSLAANRLYGWLVTRQRLDGSFPHSHGDYRLFEDARSYPRNLVMILNHLLEAT